MRNPYEHDYPPMRWTVENLAAALEDGAPSLPPGSEDEIWDAIRTQDPTRDLASRIISTAETNRQEPIPTITASVLRGYRNGNDDARRQWHDAYDTHINRLTRFTIAECLEGDGRFLDAVLDYAWSLCEYTSWVNPSNLWRGRKGETYSEGLPRAAPSRKEHTLDLHSTRVAFQLAELDHLLGPQLSDDLGTRIKETVLNRVVVPYDLRDDYWWLEPPTNNWNAICNACAAGSALYLDDDATRTARVVKKAVDSLQHFLNAFGPDGGTVEGVGYWNFGFGHYVMFADLLESYTDGRYSLFTPPVVKKISEFPAHVELSPWRYPAFGDSSELYGVDTFGPALLGRRFGNERLQALAYLTLTGDHPSNLAKTLHRTVRNLVWGRKLPEMDRPTPDPSVFFDGIEWWIRRADPGNPDGMVVAMKAGDNAEAHNHNDCGSFIIHLDGNSLLGDLGIPEYTSGYFNVDTRYEFLAARSLGHPVPFVNGCEQVSMPGKRDEESGNNWREVHEPTPDETPDAIILNKPTEEDENFSIELEDCYPNEAGLESLVRTFTFEPGENGNGELYLEDVAQFFDTGSFESVFVSYFPIQRNKSGFTVKNDKNVIRATTERDIKVERLENAVETVPAIRSGETQLRDVWRAKIQANSGQNVSVSVSLEPHAGF